MSLPTHQQHSLDEIDDALQAGEPQLAAMFVIFARLNQAEGPVAAERLGRRKGDAIRALRGLVLIPLAIAMLIGGLVFGITRQRPGGCTSPAAHVAAVSAAYAPAGCGAGTQHLGPDTVPAEHVPPRARCPPRHGARQEHDARQPASRVCPARLSRVLSACAEP